MYNTLFILLAQAQHIFPDKTGIPNTAQDYASPTLIQTVLKYVFMLAGAVALLIITFAGTQYVLSQGDPQKVAKAKNTIIYAVVGLVITIMAYSIVSFVVTRLV